MKLQRLCSVVLASVLATAVVGTVLGGVGCSSTPDARTDIGTADVYFADGPVGERLPEIWNDDLPQAVVKAMPGSTAEPARAAVQAFLQHRWTPETRAWVDGLLDTIDQQAPGFYSRFAEAMRSGKHVRVNDAFEQGIAQLKAAGRIVGARGSDQNVLRTRDLTQGTQSDLTNGDTPLTQDAGSLTPEETPGWYDVDFHVSLEYEGRSPWSGFSSSLPSASWSSFPR